MKEIVIISGKGGTGKTVITAAFATLAKNKIMADCDVDAANLHLLLNPKIKEHHKFTSGVTAIIDKSKCINCGKCKKHCRFDAVSDELIIDSVFCEGCALCKHVCPVNAINLEKNISGQWFISSTKYGDLVHAKLGIAEENSGKLVTLIRQKAKELAVLKKADYLILDGPPGIGCPVIASTIGATLAIAVLEPSLSGVHDFKRLMSLAKKIGVELKIIINKADINQENTKRIKEISKKNNMDIIGEIPYLKDIPLAISKSQPITEYLPKGSILSKLKDIWGKVI